MNSNQGTSECTSVIIVTFNSIEVALNCLNAIVSRIDSDFEVIVVDNASSDGTPDKIRERFPEVMVIESPRNVGFAKGVILGAGKAKGDIYCLLNPDAIAASETIEALAEALRRSEEIGIVAPLIIQPEGRLKVISAGRMPTVWRMFTHYSGLSRLGRFSQHLEGHYLLPDQLRGRQEVDWATGACLAIRRTTWESCGGISDRWFMYAEDIELCFKVQRSGHRVMLYSDLEVTHLLGSSAKTSENSVVKADWIVNLYDFYSTNLASKKSRGFAWRAVVSIGLFSRGVVFSLRGHNKGAVTWTRESKKFFGYSKAVALLPGRRGS